MRLRNSTCPPASAPCRWNTCFAMSKPIVVTCSMDASFGGSSTPSPWHTDAVGGRPLHHPTPPILKPKTDGGYGARLCENTGIQSARRKFFLDFVSLETNSAVAATGKRAIEKTILRLVGS